MNTVKMMIEIPGDLEAVRRLLLKLAPRMESRQPGITAQLTHADLTQPMRMATPKGEVIDVILEPRGEMSAIKVSVQPPMRSVGKVRAAWWRWRTRFFMKWTLKGVRKAIARDRAT
ncbi:hypothetical protein J7643_01985 [bacterium]|nr:hypothetical protein [bacterium]